MLHVLNMGITQHQRDPNYKFSLSYIKSLTWRYFFNSQIQLQAQNNSGQGSEVDQQANVWLGKLAHLSYLPESQGGRRKKILHVFTATSYTYTQAHICWLVIRENSLPPFSDMKAFILLLILFSVFSSRVEILVCQEPRGFQAWGIRRKCGLWKVRANPDITQLTYTPLT